MAEYRNHEQGEKAEYVFPSISLRERMAQVAHKEKPKEGREKRMLDSQGMLNCQGTDSSAKHSSFKLPS